MDGYCLHPSIQGPPSSQRASSQSFPHPEVQQDISGEPFPVPEHRGLLQPQLSVTCFLFPDLVQTAFPHPFPTQLVPGQPDPSLGPPGCWRAEGDLKPPMLVPRLGDHAVLQDKDSPVSHC